MASMFNQLRNYRMKKSNLLSKLDLRPDNLNKPLLSEEEMRQIKGGQQSSSASASCACNCACYEANVQGLQLNEFARYSA